LSDGVNGICRHLACEEDREEEVRLLVSAGADATLLNEVTTLYLVHTYIHSFIAFCSHTSCNWILKHEYKRSIKLIHYIHIKYTTIRDAPMG